MSAQKFLEAFDESARTIQVKLEVEASSELGYAEVLLDLLANGKTESSVEVTVKSDAHAMLIKLLSSTSYSMFTEEIAAALLPGVLGGLKETFAKLQRGEDPMHTSQGYMGPPKLASAVLNLTGSVVTSPVRVTR